MTYAEAVRQAKRRVVRNALRRAGGSVSRAARLLAVNRTYLHKLIVKYGADLDAPHDRRNRGNDAWRGLNA